jgi:biotin transporter BioY
MSMPLQTLVVFLIILLSEGIDGIVITSVYAILGTVGLPVFAGFNPGSVASPTYGIIIAFIVSSILVYIFDKVILKTKNFYKTNRQLEQTRQTINKEQYNKKRTNRHLLK